jgi:hypothetical protein
MALETPMTRVTNFSPTKGIAQSLSKCLIGGEPNRVCSRES